VDHHGATGEWHSVESKIDQYDSALLRVAADCRYATLQVIKDVLFNLRPPAAAGAGRRTPLRQ
jgi:hypothetical protein